MEFTDAVGNPPGASTPSSQSIPMRQSWSPSRASSCVPISC